MYMHIYAYLSACVYTFTHIYEQSGLYMIKELVHYYETRGSFTKLKLIRDTMGKKDK